MEQDETKHAGRGFLWVAGAKITFIVSAFVITAVALPRLFTDEVYGLFSVVFGFGAMINAVLIAAALQTVSKLVSEDEAKAATVLREGLVLQLVIGGAIGAGIFVGAPWIAELYHDPTRTPLIRIVGVVAFAYAVYAVCIGYLNGKRLFATQAKLDVTFSVLRTVGLIGGAAIGVGAIGAMAGFAVAAVLILVIGLLVVRAGTRGNRHAGGGAPWKRWLALMAPIALYQAALNGLMQIDLQMLNIRISEIAVADEGGMTTAEASAHADALCAAYRAAQTFAFVPYQIIIAVTFIVFPMVSRATTLGDAEAIKRYIGNAMRFSLLVLLSLATPIAGASRGVITIFYPDTFGIGADALGILIFGHVAFALFAIGANILTGAGRAKTAAVIAVIALTLVLLGTYVSIGAVGIEGHAALTATALGTSAGTFTALLLAGVLIQRIFGAFIPFKSVVRGSLAGVAGFAVARLIDPSTVLTAVAALASGFAAYGAVLFLLRELGRAEIAAVRKVIGR